MASFEKQEITISSSGVKSTKSYFRDFKEHFGMLLALTARDIKVRYKHSFLGVLWVLFQPSATTFIFGIFFGKVAKILIEKINDFSYLLIIY